MKVVIQCAGRKRPDAGKLRDADGTEISFVARPVLDERTQSTSRPCRPDDIVDVGTGTWRDVLARYNERYHQEGENPDRLLPAGDLYSPRAYRCLVDAFGAASVYILSAGWGLVRADYLLPAYDITFSNQKKVPKYARRGRRDDSWRDFNHLRDAALVPDESVHFFGGQDYLPLYYRSVDALAVRKVIYHKVALPHRPGYEYHQYLGPANTNWHYPVAEEFTRTHHGNTA